MNAGGVLSLPAWTHEDFSLDEKIETPEGAAGVQNSASETIVSDSRPAKPAAKSKAAAGKAKNAASASPQHHLSQMRHDPIAIRRVFETGEYPYASR